MKHVTMAELETGFDQFGPSPLRRGKVELIVCRPRPGAREVLSEGCLDVAGGLLGDYWQNPPMVGGVPRVPDPEAQITLMNSRVIALLAGTPERWALAGDQFFVDLNLGRDCLPPGTFLKIGSAIIQVTPLPHTGCRQFADWFGADAAKFVNSPERKNLCLRGINARVIRSGVVRTGAVVEIPEQNDALT
jgi:hypothetical protein